MKHSTSYSGMFYILIIYASLIINSLNIYINISVKVGLNFQATSNWESSGTWKPGKRDREISALLALDLVEIAVSYRFCHIYIRSVVYQIIVTEICDEKLFQSHTNCLWHFFYKFYQYEENESVCPDFLGME